MEMLKGRVQERWARRGGRGLYVALVRRVVQALKKKKNTRLQQTISRLTQIIIE